MHIIERLPYTTAAFTALITGLISYRLGHTQQTIYARMAVSMVLFFIAGIYLRSSLYSIKLELDKIAHITKENTETQETQADNKDTDITREAVHSIDYRVDDNEEFTPLKLSEAIRTKIL